MALVAATTKPCSCNFNLLNVFEIAVKSDLNANPIHLNRDFDNKSVNFSNNGGSFNGGLKKSKIMTSLLLVALCNSLMKLPCLLSSPNSLIGKNCFNSFSQF